MLFAKMSSSLGNYIKNISTDALPNSCNYSPIGTNNDCSLLPIHEVSGNGDSFAISPNPASNLMHLSDPFSVKYYLQIINELGQVLLTESSEYNDLSINISGIPVGVYVIRLISGNHKIEAFKFIKI